MFIKDNKCVTCELRAKYLIIKKLKELKELYNGSNCDDMPHTIIAAHIAALEWVLGDDYHEQ